MSAVISIAPAIRQIEVPTALRELPGWLMWKAIPKEDGSGKLDKIPYYANGKVRKGGNGTPQDRAQLVTFDVAKAAAVRQGLSGVGLAMLPDWGITALDFDDCVDPDDGRLPQEVADIISSTYAEYSPSTRGIRAFVKGNLGDGKTSKSALWPYGFEAFSAKGFVTVTGNALEETGLLGLENHLDDAPEHAVALCVKRFGAQEKQTHDDRGGFFDYAPPADATDDQVREYVNALDPDLSYPEWRNVGMALHHQYNGDEEGLEIWREWSTGGSKYKGSEDLDRKWASFSRPREGRPISFATVIKMAQDADPARFVIAASGLRPLTVEEPSLNTAGFDGKIKIFGSPLKVRREVWLIDKILPKAKFAMVYGPPGSGKTFIILDMAFAIGRGIEWQGRATKKMKVLYIAAESQLGMQKRIVGYYLANKIPLGTDLGVHFIFDSPNVRSPEDLRELKKTIDDVTEHHGGYDAVIFDTLARVSTGTDENSSKDAGEVIDAIEKMVDSISAMGIVLHHTGKDITKGARGSTAYTGALDTQIEISREGERHQLRTTKQKDGEDDVKVGFKLTQIWMPVTGGESGEMVSTCVVEKSELPVATAPAAKGPRAVGRRLGRLEQHIVEIMAQEIIQGTMSWDLEKFSAHCRSTMTQPLAGEVPLPRESRVAAIIQGLGKGKDAYCEVENGIVYFNSYR